jgi:hypothetical protein
VSPSHGLQSSFAPFAVFASPHVFSCHMCTGFLTEFVSSYAEKLVFLGYILSENDPSFVQTNNFVDGHMLRRVVKFWKCPV